MKIWKFHQNRSWSLIFFFCNLSTAKLEVQTVQTNWLSGDQSLVDQIFFPDTFFKKQWSFCFRRLISSQYQVDTINSPFFSFSL